MYLKKGYFADLGPHAADDIGQGYLTHTFPADDLPPEIVEAAVEWPELLDQFKTDETLLFELANEPDAERFRMYRNEEVSFDGLSDTGYVGYGLEIAFNEARKFALVAYTGPGLPAIVRRYSCDSADAATCLWTEDWAAPLIVTMFGDNDNNPDANLSFR
jgi:hypothetical protein